MSRFPPKKPDAKDPRQAIERVLRALEETTGLQVCIKVHRSEGLPGTALEEVLQALSMHRTDFCMGVKRTRNAQCIACDLRAVPALCRKKRRLFVNTCHAGACEIVLPLFHEEALRAVIYLGQFRLRAGQPESLPLWSRERLRRVTDLCGLLEAYLNEQWRTPAFSRETSLGYRRERINRFLRQNLRRNPSLDDLARHLGLSAPRTTHVVKEVTGQSFLALRDGLRLEWACDLLRGTYHKVSHVAAESGFASAHYFHRFFRRRTGMTPLAFRRLRRPEV